MDLGLAGRVAIVTGASRGIGAATCETLLDEGVAVVAGARDASHLESFVAAVGGGDRRIVGVPVDVSDRTSSDVLRDAALKAFGRVDIIVNNAGGWGAPLQRFNEDEWHDLYTLNVTSALRLTMACMPLLREQRWGRVVNVASTAGRHCDPRWGAYGASKAAMLHVSRSLAQAYSKDGVLTNCVLPGLTRTHSVLTNYESAAAASGRTPDDIERRMMELEPIAAGRPGEPEEIAAMIVFLCSERSSWTTGAEILVDGGSIRDTP